MKTFEVLKGRFSGELAHPRCGAILVLAAVLMMVVLAFTAFTVDIGYIAVTKSQLQNATDAGALAAAAELSDGWGPSKTLTTDGVTSAARSAATAVAAANPAGGLDAVYLSGARDVQLGQLQWTGTEWTKTWGTPPFNLVEVIAHRDQGSSSSGDGSLKLFFGGAVASKTANLSEHSYAGLLPGVGFEIGPGNAYPEVLPITLDVGTWNAMLAGNGSDHWNYDKDSGAITAGSDGVLEVDLYPSGSSLMPPGNRGTVDFGPSGNSTNDIKRQILYGLNESDLAYFGGELRFDSVPLIINGDTGLSAGIKAELEAIKGKPRAIPLFSAVSGPGNNAMYTIVKFVGIRILDVKLTGGNKYVTIQPAPFVSATVITGNVTVTEDSIFGPPSLIK